MLDATLADLTRGAEDIDPILHSFKNAQHLRVGVRDILGKDDVEHAHAALADVAEVCLRQIATREKEKLRDKFGTPTIPSFEHDEAVDDELRERFAGREGDQCGLVILALGKLGGREPNYHSDLDVVFLYECEGRTYHVDRNGGKTTATTTSNNHFFSELGQRIITRASRIRAVRSAV